MDTAMKEDTSATGKKNRGGRILPIIVSFCMLLCLGAVLFALGRVETAGQKIPQAPAAAKNEEIESLRRQKTKLEELLQQEPCRLRQSLGLPQRSAPGSGGPDPSASSALKETTAAPPQPPAAANNAAQDGPSATTSKNESVDKIEDATVFIISEAGEEINTGTGFFVAPDMVISNAHVVGNTPAWVFIINHKLGAPVQATVVSVRGGQSTGGADYALLRVPRQQAIQPLALRDTPRRTEKVNAWGYPRAISKNDPKYQALVMRGQMDVAPELVFSDGAVSAILERTPPLIIHTAPLSQGNSGGPLTDEKGLVVGINTLISLDDESYRQTSIALPASDFISFLQQNGVAVTLVKP